MSTLELNIKAKRVAPVEAPKTTATAPIGGVLLEVGKKYITIIGEIATMEEYHYGTGWLRGRIQGRMHYTVWKPDGEFVGFGPLYQDSIAREWFSTWEWEQAWRAGKKMEYFHPIDEMWRDLILHPYKTIVGVFGSDSKTTNGYWEKNYHPVLAAWTIRVKE